MILRDLKNKRVTVMGLGRLGGGVGVVKFLAAHGAKLLVTDIKKAEELEDSLKKLRGISNVEFVLGHHRNEDFIERDFIVKNPGVPKRSPYLLRASQARIPIETDISLFFKLAPCHTIGVTGTKGKSTAASLIQKFLASSYSAFVGGNIGITPLELLDKIDANSLVVLELSSWQLEDLAPHKVSPYVAVILNVYPDHLNRHPDLQDYIEAKKNIIRYQTSEGSAVLNYDDPIVREFSSEVKGKLYFFSKREEVNGAYMKGEKVYFGQGEEGIIDRVHISLPGEHNLSNILAALTLAKIYKVSSRDISKALESFTGIPWRQELIREIGGIAFYNDTTATIPEAAIAALKRFEKNIILIAGGVDKGLDYRELAKEIANRVKFLVLLPGDASEKINSRLTTHDSRLKVIKVEGMEEAVKSAFKNAQSGDTIILSPGAASFNVFKNEFDRGEQFNKAVAAL
ncbi:MAG: UDP-N-acetylmuramoyl-L-alanine--D-glutamate ligase [Candidatus Portnoybacteria bacterium]|nr:UDP-N-acetylmuramoyl-L-alanine--D-glutamate ligase [Candidatus Portnoybacteria bacterium]